MKIQLFHALLIITILITHSSSEISNIRITNDPRPLILFDRFRFSKHGQAVVYVENVSYKLIRLKTYTPLDPSQMAFFLLKDDDDFFFNTYQICTASTHYVKPIFRFNDLAIDSTYNATIAISEPNKYNLVFANCQAQFYTVSMTIATEMYNLHNGEKNFLPAGQIHLPELYFVFFGIYTVLLAIWTYICMQKRPNLDKIHYIMCALLIFKALNLLCDAEDKMYIAETGKPNDIAFYVFSFFKGAIVFTGIVLISAAWSILKNFLHGGERKVLEIVIPIQVFENVAYFVVEETGPATGSDVPWGHVFLSVDIVCCMAVMVTVVRSIRDLKDTTRGDGRLEKLCIFMKLYVVVVGYFYFTRVGVAALGDHMFEWIGVGATEVATLGFYGFLLWNFSSVEKINSYFRINDYEAENQIEISQVLRRSEIEEYGDDDDIFEL